MRRAVAGTWGRGMFNLINAGMVLGAIVLLVGLLNAANRVRAHVYHLRRL
ncbi:MAG: hypothetical protein Kow00120_12730 [Anaerolineae bacterium]